MTEQTVPARGAVIGCGFFAANHLAAWRDITGANVIATCDLDRQKAELGAELVGGAKAYTDLAEMLRSEQLDFVDIVTTMETHEAIIDQCAEHAVPAIIQKPLAPDLAGAIRIVERMAAAGVPLMIHENFRFQRPIREVWQTLRRGAIGRPVYAEIQFRTNHDIYAKQPYLAETERLIISDVGVHVLDVARFLLGEATTLYCRAASIRPGIRGEDMMSAVLGHANGATSIVAACYQSKRPQEIFPQCLITVEGTAGSIELRPDYEMVVRSGDEVTRHDVNPTPLDWAEPPWHAVQESVLRVNEHWLQCLGEGKTPETSGFDNLKTFRLVEAAYRSVENGHAVDPTTFATIPEDPALKGRLTPG